MREYEKTHKWIDFKIDLQNSPTRLWSLLGEAASKAEHLAGVPMLPEIAKTMYHIYLARGILATTAIEGNTLTESQVLQRMAGQLELPPSQQYLGQEIDNILEACNNIQTEVSKDQPLEISPERIKAFNRQVLKNLPLKEEVTPGEIRKYSVGVGSYRGAPASDCDFLLERLCEWLNSRDFEPGSELPPLAITVLKAIISHLYIAWIHPFGDGNGRTARLLEFQILFDGGFPAPASQLLSNHYNQTRSQYYSQLDRTSRSLGDETPFILYAVEGLVDQLREQIHVAQEHQLEVSWERYVHETLSGVSQGIQRKRKLLLALSREESPVRRADLLRISPEVAGLYINRTPKTLTRDINALLGMDLIISEGEEFRANKRKIRAFLPVRRPRLSRMGAPQTAGDDPPGHHDA